MNEKITESLTKYFDACEHIKVVLHWLKKNNHLYKSFLACFETMYQYLRQDIVNLEMLKLNQDTILENEAIGMAFPKHSAYFDQYSPLYGNLDIAGIQNPQPFAKDVNFPFFMFDYMTKIHLWAYNARKVVKISKLEEQLIVGKAIAVKKLLCDPFASYGTEVPHVVPGFKQYWKSFGYDLVAMTEQLGILDFFLTLSPNDNWPHIQSTIKRGWRASTDPSEFKDLLCKSGN